MQIETLIHYHWKEGDEVIVQNMAADMSSQLYRHSPEGFERWIKENDIKQEHLVDLDAENRKSMHKAIKKWDVELLTKETSQRIS